MSAHFAAIRVAARPALRLELDLDRLADEVATRVAARPADQIASQASSPWTAMEEAIAYTRSEEHRYARSIRSVAGAAASPAMTARVCAA